VLALTQMSPPADSGLSHWSSREMAAYVTRTEQVPVSHHWVAKLWREHGLKPHRSGTFKLSRDPAFAAKVADIVGLYLDPPGGAVVQAIRRGTFSSVQVLIRSIRDYITTWNADPRPFQWTATADEITGQSPTRTDQHQATRRQQRQVNPSGLRAARYGSSSRTEWPGGARF
jgi:hypothetical protein